jgi:cellulose synthase/poly-beta-1,6-N-acetylglucosamine synthase-like glycosyltransferase
MTKSGQDGMDEKLQLPKVSVILAARDEERHIWKRLDSLVSQDYPNYEIIAIDDASTDRTAEIIYKFATANPSKVTAVIRQDNLPEGWTGKNWVCFQGYQMSSGEILLFSDADAVYSSDTVSLAVQHMTNENLDALTARPKIFSDNLLTRIVLPFSWMASHVFCSAMKVNNPESKTGFVFGGFYLITRKAYESLGTHQSIKSEISEDLEIGRRLKQESVRNDDEKCTPNAHHKKYRLKMFLGNQNILNSFAPDNAALYSAIRRTVNSFFQKAASLNVPIRSSTIFHTCSPMVNLAYLCLFICPIMGSK